MKDIYYSILSDGIWKQKYDKLFIAQPELYQFKNIYIEFNDFDKHKLQDEYIEGEMYQQDLMNGFDNIKNKHKV